MTGGSCTDERWFGNRNDLFAVDSDHHDLRVVAVDDHSQLLDIIFRWIPFFIFCFPLPKLKGKD